jgi:hypothetical protein
MSTGKKVRRKYLTVTFLVVIVLGLPAGVLRAAVVYPFEVFSNNGSYYNSPDLDLYVEVSEGEGQAGFTFYNESLIDSSIARIYFDGGSLLGIADITEGAGTSFSQPATPGNLPGGNPLESPFVTTDGFSIGSEAPRPHSGVNPGEWVQITFDLISGGSFQSVIDELNTGALRIGIHVIALPDGSSEGAIAVPEPATIFLLGLGALALLRKRRA